MSLSAKQKQLKQLGLCIKKIRMAAEVACNQLAFEIGTSEKYLRQLEKGELNFGVIKLYQVAESLDVDIRDFFKD